MNLDAINQLTQRIIGAAIEVHREKGPGLLESAYEACFAHELELQNLRISRQVAVPVIYKGLTIESGFRVDLIIEDKVLVELKAVESVLPVHKAQILSYIRETGHPLGLLINFHAPRLVDGITRIVNDRSQVAFSATSVLKIKTPEAVR